MTDAETRKKANNVSIVLGTIGVLLFISTGFNLFPFKYAAFLGVACFILAGMSRRLMMRHSD